MQRVSDQWLSIWDPLSLQDALGVAFTVFATGTDVPVGTWSHAIVFPALKTPEIWLTQVNKGYGHQWPSWSQAANALYFQPFRHPYKVRRLISLHKVIITLSVDQRHLKDTTVFNNSPLTHQAQMKMEAANEPKEQQPPWAEGRQLSWKSGRKGNNICVHYQ